MHAKQHYTPLLGAVFHISDSKQKKTASWEEAIDISIRHRYFVPGPAFRCPFVFLNPTCGRVFFLGTGCGNNLCVVALLFYTEPPHDDAHQEPVVFAYGALLPDFVGGERSIGGALLGAVADERHGFSHGRNHDGEMEGASFRSPCARGVPTEG